jgi:signal recognition particle subunit SRP54
MPGIPGMGGGRRKGGAKGKKGKKGAARSGNPAKRADLQRGKAQQQLAGASDASAAAALPDDFELPAEFTDLLPPGGPTR